MLMALSPAMVFYSRMYIQEALFACFALAFVIGVGRVATGGGLAWAVITGVAAGLAIATKETAAIVLPAALVGRRDCLVVARTRAAAERADRRPLAPGSPRQPHHRSGGRGALLFVVLRRAGSRSRTFPRRRAPISFAGSTLPVTPSRGTTTCTCSPTPRPAASAGVRDSSSRSPSSARSRPGAASDGSSSELQLLAALPRRLRRHCRRDLFGDSLQDALEPAAVLCRRVRARRGWVRGARERQPLARGPCVAGSRPRGRIHPPRWQAWRAAITYAADPRNPYVYAQTVPDAVRMAARIRNLSAIHPDGARMQVSVIAPPYEQWPLPWYLRAMPNVGYWTAPGDVLALQAPVIVSSLEHTPALEQALGDRYVSDIFGLRPELLLAVHIERGLWDRFLATTVSGV